MCKNIGWFYGVYVCNDCNLQRGASMTVAQVAAIHPGTRSLETIVTGEGTMEQQTENGFWTLAGLVLEKVYVQKGRSFIRGDVLAKVQAKSLEERYRLCRKRSGARAAE